MLYLVTGGAGFIGSHIAEALVKRGDRVRVLDNLITGRRENLSAIADGIEFIEGDIRDYATTLRAAEGAGVIFHQAAVPSVPRSVAEPALNHDINVNGTFNVLMAAREARAASGPEFENQQHAAGVANKDKNSRPAPAPAARAASNEGD